MAIGHSMWGGRGPDDVGERRAIRVDTEDEPVAAGFSTGRLIASLILVLLATILLVTGLALILGIGGALVGAGLSALMVGIMLGMGDET